MQKAKLPAPHNRAEQRWSPSRFALSSFLVRVVFVIAPRALQSSDRTARTAAHFTATNGMNADRVVAWIVQQPILHFCHVYRFLCSLPVQSTSTALSAFYRWTAFFLYVLPVLLVITRDCRFSHGFVTLSSLLTFPDPLYFFIPIHF